MEVLGYLAKHSLMGPFVEEELEEVWGETSPPGFQQPVLNLCKTFSSPPRLPEFIGTQYIRPFNPPRGLDVLVITQSYTQHHIHTHITNRQKMQKRQKKQTHKPTQTQIHMHTCLQPLHTNNNVLSTVSGIVRILPGVLRLAHVRQFSGTHPDQTCQKSRRSSLCLIQVPCVHFE